MNAPGGHVIAFEVNGAPVSVSTHPVARLSAGRVTPAEWKHILNKSEKPAG